MFEKWSIKITKKNSLIIGEYFKVVADCYMDWGEENIKNYLNSHNIHNEPVEKKQALLFQVQYLDLQKYQLKNLLNTFLIRRYINENVKNVKNIKK